jgi:hypothetical protein
MDAETSRVKNSAQVSCWSMPKAKKELGSPEKVIMLTRSAQTNITFGKTKIYQDTAYISKNK